MPTVLISPHPHQHLLFSGGFLKRIIANLNGTRWHFIVVLIYISVFSDDIKYLLFCLLATRFFFGETYIQFFCLSVCVHVYVCACVCDGAHVCGCMSRTEDNLKCYSPGTTYWFLFCFVETRSLTSLEVAK